MGVLCKDGPAVKRPLNVTIHKTLQFILLLFAFFLIFSLTYADGFIPRIPAKVPHYIPYKNIPFDQRYLPDTMPLPVLGPKEFSFTFVPDGQYLFYSADWKDLSQNAHGIKLSYKSKDSKKAYMEYKPKGSFTLENLGFDNPSLIYAVKLEPDALVPEGTSISYVVNGSEANEYAFLGKTSLANIGIALSTDHDYLSPFLKSLKITLYPIKDISINPVIVQTNESSISVDLKNYVNYYGFAMGNLKYKLLDSPPGCNIIGSILTCNSLSDGTKYYALEVSDPFSSKVGEAPIQITKNSNSPYFTDLPTISVQEDSQIAPLDLTPYIQDPNNTPSELSLSIDYIAPASGINCEVDSFTLNCSLVKDAYGIFVVMLKVEDPQGNSSMTDLKINISQVNDTPSWNSIPIYNLEEGQSLNLNLANFVSDVDNPSSTLSFELKDNGGLICNLSTSVLSCSTPQYPYSTTIVVSAADSQYEVDTEIPVSWSKDNLAPTFSGTIIGKTSTTANLSYSLDLSKYFSDPEGSNLSYNYQILSGSAICNISNNELSCNLNSQGYSDVKVSASDGEKSTYSNVFRLAKVSPTDLTATVDVPHTVPLDYTVYFQVYVTNNLSIYLEGVEVTASSSELIIFDGDPVGHTTITEVLPKLEPNSTVESEFHTTVGGTEKTYNIMLMLNGQQLDSKQIETKNIFYSAGNNLVNVWQDQGDNDGAGYWGTGMQGSIPKDNKLKIKVHITSLYDVPLNDLNLCYVSQNGLLKPMSNGQTLTLNVFCQLVTVPALDELVIEQEVMPTVLGSEQQNFILGKGAVQYGSPANLIGGTDMTDFKIVNLSEGLAATWDELPDDSVLSKNTTYNLNVYLINYFAVPIYNVTACMRLVELNPNPTFSFTENSYIKVVGQGCKTYINTPYASGPGSNELGISNTQQYTIKTKNLSTSYVGVGIVAGANQDIVLGGKPYSIQ